MNISRATQALVVMVSLIAVAGGCTSDGSDATAPKPTTTTAPIRSSAGCGTAPAVSATDGAAPGDIPLTITVGRQERSYRLGIPSSYDRDTPAPVVLNLHGSGGSAVVQNSVTEMPMQAAKRGFITITPDAVAGNWELASAAPTMTS